MIRMIVLGLIFCANAASAGVDSMSSSSLTRGIDGKNPGDVISLQKDQAIAAWCDFNKQIVVTATSTLCVYKR